MLDVGLNAAAPSGQLPNRHGTTVQFRTKRGVVAVTLDPDVVPASQEEAIELAKAAISQLAALNPPAKARTETGKSIRIDDGALFRSWALGSS